MKRRELIPELEGMVGSVLVHRKRPYPGLVIYRIQRRRRHGRHMGTLGYLLVGEIDGAVLIEGSRAQLERGIPSVSTQREAYDWIVARAGEKDGVKA